MKKNSLQSLVFENRWHRVVLLVAFLSLICVTVTSPSAQSKNPRRVTALQVGAAVEGSRVTIVSDSVLNDYEAFRRGDRFYVRIPLSDFTAAQPSFRSHGFEDVRVQEVGNDVVVSFKLQPGASARVDQHSNRLEVVFSAFGVSRSGTPANGYPLTRKRRNTGSSDAVAGPMPPASSAGPIGRLTTTRRASNPAPFLEKPASNSGQDRRGAKSAGRDLTLTGTEAIPKSTIEALRGNSSAPRGATKPGTNSNSRSNSTAENLPPKATPSPASPASSPGIAGPVSSAATPTPFSTPAIFATPRTEQPFAAPVSGNTGSPEATSWDGRIKLLKAWARLNKSALLTGGLIALALLIGIVLWSRLKDRGTATGRASQKKAGKQVSEKVAAKHVHRDGEQEREVFEL